MPPKRIRSPTKHSTRLRSPARLRSPPRRMASPRRRYQRGGEAQADTFATNNHKVQCNTFCDANGDFRYDLKNKNPNIDFSKIENLLEFKMDNIASNARWCRQNCKMPFSDDIKKKWKSVDEKCQANKEACFDINELINSLR